MSDTPLIAIEETDATKPFTVSVNRGLAKKVFWVMLVAVLGAGGGGSALTTYLNFGSPAAAEEDQAVINKRQDMEIKDLKTAYTECAQAQQAMQGTVNTIAINVATLLERTKNQ